MKLNTPYNPELDILYVELPFYETWHRRRLEDLDIQQFADDYCYDYAETDPEGVRMIVDYGVSDYSDLPETAQKVWQEQWEFDFAAAKVIYAEELFNHLAAEYGLELMVLNIAPTRDNFQRPDLVVLSPVGAKNAERIAALIREDRARHQALADRVREMTTRRDGYMPFYTEYQLWADRGWLTQLSLGILLDEYLDGDQWDDAWHTSVQCTFPSVGHWKEAA